MKKLVLVLLVAMLSVPAFAAPAIDLVDLGGRSVALDYTTSGSLISGLGVKITITGGTVVTFTNGATKYWVHPNNVVINGSGVVTDLGSPVFEGTAVGASVFTVEYGALYNRSASPVDPNKPAASGRLCTFTVSGTGNYSVVATSNTIQGGVVTEDLVAYTALTDTLSVTAAPAECYKSTSPDYAAWVAFGKPDCWCYQRNCRGDINGLKAGLYWVSSADLTLLKAAYTKSDAVLLTITNGLCADVNRIKSGLYRVTSSDLTVLKTYYTNSTVPICDFNLVNEWKN